VAEILIVDDSAILRKSLRSCIEQNTDWHVCGEAENGRVAVEKVRGLQPDLVILDFAMPVMNGLDAAREITIIAPSTPLLLFTMLASSQITREAKAAGITDVLSKGEGGPDNLIASLHAILDHLTPAPTAPATAASAKTTNHL
jgi:DNA-binding NarL/FixJ family response regulator